VTTDRHATAGPYHDIAVTDGLSTVALRPQGTARRGRSPAKVSAMTTERRAVGAYGERMAERHLTAAGLVVLDRNWRCRDGEVDLILRDGDDVVFCEVKTRRTDLFGTPAEAIDAVKVRRLRRLAALWLAQTSVRPREIRFDVVQVWLQRRGATLVEHTRAAF
jgi:putative endonuclease